MASVLAFNSVSAPTGNVPPEKFANGTGILTITGFDVDVSTADFKRHYVRKAINRSGRFSAYGNLVEDLRSPGGLGGTITLALNGQTIASFTGILIPRYDENSMTTVVDIKGDGTIT